MAGPGRHPLRVDDPDAARQSLERGASAFVFKHIDPRDLAAALRQVAEGTVFSHNVGAPEDRREIAARGVGLTRREGDPDRARHRQGEQADRLRARSHRAGGQVPPDERVPKARRSEPCRGASARHGARPARDASQSPRVVADCDRDALRCSSVPVRARRAEHAPRVALERLRRLGGGVEGGVLRRQRGAAGAAARRGRAGGAQVTRLLTTHTHHDHVAGDDELARRFGVSPERGRRASGDRDAGARRRPRHVRRRRALLLGRRALPRRRRGRRRGDDP